MLELRHYADKQVTLDRSRVYRQLEYVRPYTKPVGFWVSVLGEDDWPSWCMSEEFQIESLAFEHAVTIADGANILLLGTATALDRFTEEFGVRTVHSLNGSVWTNVHINWHGVISRYDGIIIAPYQWERRLELDWYYGFDCASGCIWNLSAIASLEWMEKVNVPNAPA